MVVLSCALAGGVLAFSIWSFWAAGPTVPAPTTLEFELASDNDIITCGQRAYTWPRDAESIYEAVLSRVMPSLRDRDGLPLAGAEIRVPENTRPVRLWRLLALCKLSGVSWVRVERGDDKVVLRVVSVAEFAELLGVEPRMARLGLLMLLHRESVWSLTELQAEVILRGPCQIWFAPSEEWGYWSAKAGGGRTREHQNLADVQFQGLNRLYIKCGDLGVVDDLVRVLRLLRKKHPEVELHLLGDFRDTGLMQIPIWRERYREPLWWAKDPGADTDGTR